MAVTDGTAVGIAAELDSFLTGLGIFNWKSKLVGLGTDGASVNVGCHGGLGAILKQEIPYLLQIHCIAHRLELAVLDTCKHVEFVGNFQETIKSVLKFYSHSSKRVNELSEVGNALTSAIHTFGSWNPVRWIASKSRILKAMDSNWSATMLHLEQKASGGKRDEAATANGLLKKMCTVKFVYFLGFMCDFTSALTKLSEANELSLSDALDELDDFCISLKVHRGIHLLDLYKILMTLTTQLNFVVLM